MSLYDFSKDALLPGSLGLFFLCLLLGLAALRFRRTARLGAFGLSVLAAGYLTMSLPIGAWLLDQMLSAGYTSRVEKSQLAGVRAIVVLDANTIRYGVGDLEIGILSRPGAMRALEAVRVYRSIEPALVLVSGGSNAPLGRTPEGTAMREVLKAAGVPAERLLLDSRSRNTRESASTVASILRTNGISRIALVTSSVHMRRALRAFAGTGLQVVPAPAVLQTPRISDWWPRSSALDRSWEAWYEVVGLGRDLLR